MSRNLIAGRDEIARTAPYMHDGSIATREEVIEFYNRGGTRTPTGIRSYDCWN